jgi:Zn-dependent protease
MFSSWKLGRVAGIDLFLHPTFLILLAYAFIFYGGAAGAVFLLAVFGCVLLHELGHSLTARGFGIETRRITLSPIGGVAALDRMPRSPGGELLITLAGPAVNLAIALVLTLVLRSANVLEPYSGLSMVGRFVSDLVTVNLVLAAFNMIPAFPMDGGRILRAVLSGWLGRVRATEIAATIGQVIALAFPFVMMLLDRPSILHFVLAGFVYFAAAAELAAVRAEGFSRRRNGRSGVGPIDPGIWFAPHGYTWVRRGAGAWQLVPITVAVDSSQGFAWLDGDATPRV